MYKITDVYKETHVFSSGPESITRESVSGLTISFTVGGILSHYNSTNLEICCLMQHQGDKSRAKIYAVNISSFLQKGKYGDEFYHRPFEITAMIDNIDEAEIAINDIVPKAELLDKKHSFYRLSVPIWTDKYKKLIENISH